MFRLARVSHKVQPGTGEIGSRVFRGASLCNGKNLRDFMAVFLNKGVGTTPTEVPYDFNELVTDLNEVVKYDWATFLNGRVSGINPRGDVECSEEGGYKLVYPDKPSDYEKAVFALRGRARVVCF